MVRYLMVIYLFLLTLALLMDLNFILVFSFFINLCILNFRNYKIFLNYQNRFDTSDILYLYLEEFLIYVI
jgi:hypothetical protein